MATREIYILYRGDKMPFGVDYGENTAGQTSGPLPAGETVVSAVVTVEVKPTGASDPTIGSVTVNSTSEYVNGRLCSAGEAVLFPVTIGASQAYGLYVLKVTATTTSGAYIKSEPARFIVEPLQ